MKARRQAFTLIELLVVIAIIAILAGMIMSLVGPATERAKKARVQGQLRKLEAAIAAYKGKIGVYPPDDASNTKDVRLSPLYYELRGTYYVRVGGNQANYIVPGTNPSEEISSGLLLNLLGTEGIVNSKSREEDVRAYLQQVSDRDYKSLPVTGGEIHLFVVPVEGPNPFMIGGVPVNVWRYNSSNPTNNPNSYDLWAEVLIRGKTNIIGNWKE
jgi:prepilin-type N-terminal cleavage/methylation domain-containing protein